MASLTIVFGCDNARKVAGPVVHDLSSIRLERDRIIGVVDDDEKVIARRSADGTWEVTDVRVPGATSTWQDAEIIPFD